MDPGETSGGIKVLDGGSIHKITSGQVVVDLQTAVKELVENSLDAGATTIEVRFKDYGLESFEVIDNGSGISPADYDSIALKHHTSKLSSFTDLEAVTTFGFRGEALSSLCALADSVAVTTATSAEAPVGTVIEFERTGKTKSRKGKAARQRGTTVTVSGLFKPLPVRRKELERHAKREFGKALTLLHAYALVPCAHENRGVRLSVTNHPAGGKKSSQLRTDGTPSTRASVSAIWGPKALENLVDLELDFGVEVEAAVLRRLGKTPDDESRNEVKVRGLISKFVVGCGRTGTDRQFFFVNGRPCAPSKVQKAFNEVYRSFNATQAPFIVADFILPTNSCDVNVSPDKRTILLHSENNLVQALKIALEEKYAPARSTFDVNATQTQLPRKAGTGTDSVPQASQSARAAEEDPLFLPEDPSDEPPNVPSQPSTEGTMSQGPRPTSPDPLEEPTFGEPTLLLTSSQPASAPSSSQEPFTGVSSGREEDPVDPAAQGIEDLLPASQSARVDAPATYSGSTSTARVTPRSPTITQMVAKRSARTSSRVRDVEVDSDAEEIPGPELNDERNSPPLRKTTSDTAISDDAPIPTIKPPTNPKTRPSLQPHSSTSSSSRAEQMVLSTSGASWNLRRAADSQGSSSAERPRKRGRRDSPEAPRKDARQGMRDLLRGFARVGSKVEEATMDVDEDEEGENGEVGDAEEDEDGEGAGGAELDEQIYAPEERGETGDDAQSVTMDNEPEDLPDVELGQDGDVDMPPQDTLPGDGDIEMAEHLPGNHEVVNADSIHPANPEVIDLSASPEHNPERSDIGTSSTIATAVSEEIVRTNDREGVSLTFDLARVTRAWKTLHTRLADAQRAQEVREVIVRESGQGMAIDAADEDATESLSRVIDKADFAAMDVVGQFNLGFIIVRRRKAASTEDGAAGAELEMDDLFIVDQHAADEKYNFETLQQTTKIDSQQLFHPQVLELTAADELVALENIDVLRQNGFELAVCEDRPPGQRVQLRARPISKGTVFDTKDLEELLQLLQDRPAGQMVRCSKARAMFAMRACRMSIMIGTPLSRRQMTSVVQHMGTMDQPWHCPHGRPTMRHLSDIAGAGWERARAVDWAAFARAEA